MQENIFLLPDDLRDRITTALGSIPDNYILINTDKQSLEVIHHESSTATFAISSSKYGTGNQEGSYKTPLGIHRIVEKIGDGAPAGRIFKDRKDTGTTWVEEMDEEENLILTRILRLEGLEPGINKGPTIDSYERYIYIHGTNNEKAIGTPNSHGCVCMKNDDIIELFSRIPENTLVIIT